MAATTEHVRQAEIIAFSSGKGGTGKTFIASCLGYALVRSGHRVLMVDGDPGTDGLSLFLLGREGMLHVKEFRAENLLTSVLHDFAAHGQAKVAPRRINRAGPGDHGVVYNALISGKTLYGDVPEGPVTSPIPDLSREVFRAAIEQLFAQLKSTEEWDYILVDTRGGFGFETTEICAAADSFIVITEADYTSFYQDRNLVLRISKAAEECKKRPLLRAILVNKASEGAPTEGEWDLSKLEASFRVELTREFPIKFEDTHGIPLDLEAVKTYKTQRIPYVTAAASPFSFATLTAFGRILHVVTAEWEQEQIQRWNELVDSVSRAITERNAVEKRERDEHLLVIASLEKLTKETQSQKDRIAELERELGRQTRQYEREIERTQVLFTSKPPPGSERVKIPEGAKPAPDSVKSASARGFKWYIVWLCAAAAVIAIAAFVMLRPTRDPLSQVYNASVPTVTRVQDLRLLIDTTRTRQFDNIDLSGANLSRFNLSNTSFRRAKLVAATLTDANLANADLSYADLTGADLTGANLSQTRLSGANLQNAQVTPQQLAAAQDSPIKPVEATPDQLDTLSKRLKRTK